MHEFIPCPSCHRVVRMPASLLPYDVQCPCCGATFKVAPSALPACQPHRGALVLTTGLLSLVGVVLGGFPGVALGAAAWRMAHRDLQDMRHGAMDPEGEDMTRFGRVCGMIGLVLGVVSA